MRAGAEGGGGGGGACFFGTAWRVLGGPCGDPYSSKEDTADFILGWGHISTVQTVYKITG